MEDATLNVAPPDSAAPGGVVITDDVACPMCEYNLRGLTESRCPECGYRFDLRQMRDARTRVHPYLFEHHPERNVGSFVQTAWRGLRPWRFWRELHAAMPSRPGRLFAYALTCAVLTLSAVLAIAIPAAFETAAAARQARAAFATMAARAGVAPGTPRYLTGQAQWDTAYPLPPRVEFFEWLWRARPDVVAAAHLVLLVLAWPFLTLAALMIFQISMRRARVRTIHVIRCAAYGFDVLIWVALPLLVTLPLLAWAYGGTPFGRTLAQFRQMPPYTPNRSGAFFSSGMLGHELSGYLIVAQVILGAAISFATLKLAAAYRLYLKFDHPTLTVLSSQVVVILLVGTLLLVKIDSPVWSFWYRLLTGIRY